ncbi:hypothetical protein A2467_00540 [Candidatus Nomurabacteria bacterium RIFOXYC2_FULL_36_8]|nr:MAG: hypothetical protein UR97_C0010G0006 [Candidatus Nomurabacteria bacterium GW2011_GWE2_36_115]KKP93214.1 MAG: hypothetical protein US00_C0010G0006 [Candidatus Nomurabacteria bacterium GW2011_GWF2_36_126]KKP97058.1 MAG: hypothetical protein US04_C0001G0561 [Candidatus Nomurabacteria bacterium GW2011_GWD2_36_14]KKP99338.1 MAG: hypothetical protein US08_C0001G0020 [Candidatus Nomurabacteria bacterium GW2011_GWF2_36_19]KKQ04898.1 MAG: hypothetical protein US17_C0011G0006 [Candidatus Nomuraba
MLVKKENVVDIYNVIAKDYAKTFLKPTSYIEIFLKLLPKKGKILDVGCGVGTDSGFAKSKGFFPVGIDLSKEMLKIAKHNYPLIDFHLGDMRKIKLHGKFDGIIASYSLIHIIKKEIPGILRNFNKILNDKGLLYIALQSGQSDEIFINEPFDHKRNLFLNIISSSEINNLLKENGFKIIKEYKRKSKGDEINFTKLFIIAQKI